MTTTWLQRRSASGRWCKPFEVEQHIDETPGDVVSRMERSEPGIAYRLAGGLAK